MKGRRHRLSVAELQPPSLEIAESVVMSWLRVPSKVFQSFEVCINARSSAYAYFWEIVEGRSYVQMLKRRGAKTDPCGRPFRKRRNLLRLLSPMERVKLLFRISSIIIWIMCLSGTSLSSLQVRPRCQTVS